MSDEKMAAGFEACRLLVLSLLNRKPVVSAHDVSELGNPFNGWRNANGGQVSTSLRIASSFDIASGNRPTTETEALHESIREGIADADAGHTMSARDAIRAERKAGLLQALRSLTDDEREELFHNFCKGCFRYLEDGDTCHCTNDE